MENQEDAVNPLTDFLHKAAKEAASVRRVGEPGTQSDSAQEPNRETSNLIAGKQ